MGHGPCDHPGQTRRGRREAEGHGSSSRGHPICNQQIEELRGQLVSAKETRAGLQAKVDSIPELQVSIKAQVERLEQFHLDLSQLKEEKSELAALLEGELNGRGADRDVMLSYRSFELSSPRRTGARRP